MVVALASELVSVVDLVEVEVALGYSQEVPQERGEVRIDI